MKRIFSGLILCSLAFAGFAQTQTIERQMVFRNILPNTALQRSVTAVTSKFSARCSAHIPYGQLILSINNKQMTITPTKVTASISGVAGIPMSNGKNSYTYSIVWKAPIGSFSQSVTLACLGQTTVKVPIAGR